MSVLQSGWVWSNPTPQGETLNDVAFAGARGYAVGQEGTVLRSDDGGRTWIGLPSETQSNLLHVQVPDPNTVIVGGGCTLRESTNAGVSFQRLPVISSEHGCASEIVSFSFLNASTGFIKLTDGEILRTTDSGRTVEAKASVQSGSIGNIDFLTLSTGFTITWDPDEGGGRILRTVDGAGSWTAVATTQAKLSDVTFVTPTIGYAVGANDTLLRTTDGGSTWSAQPLTLPAGTPPLSFARISCGDATHCLVANEPNSLEDNVLVRTSDAGMTGSLVNPQSEANLIGKNLTSVAFPTASSAVAVGEEGATFLSTDGGATFANHPYARLEGVSDSHRIRIGQSPFDAYMTLEGYGEVAATTDGGLSWSVLRLPTSGELVDVAFPSTQIGYALSRDGTVFRTANAGQTWSLVDSGAREASALLAPNVNTVLVIGRAGVQRSTGGGTSFKTLDPTIVIGRRHGRLRTAKLSSFDISNGAELAGGAIFAFGNDLVSRADLYSNSVLESTDNGTRWSLIPAPVPREAIEAISFVSPTTGYETSDGRLFFTRNRGRTWTKILSLGSNTEPIYPPVNLSFSSAKDGYALLDYERSDFEPTLLKTENGGRSWIPEYLPQVIDQVLAAGAVDYAGGEANGPIFETTDGGLSNHRSTITLAIAGPRRLSAAKLRRSGGRVSLTGNLSPAQAGQSVTISYLTAHRFFWHHRTVTTNSRGAFALTLAGITASTDFVAQYGGDDHAGGAGTPAARLTVTRAKRLLSY
jgi:photosystem II stability/assembly factor-like uncharacterized protein